MQIIKDTTNFDFMGMRRGFLLMSAALVGLSLLAIFTIGPKYGIDFMGGTEIQVSFKKKTSSAEVRQAMAEMGFKGAEVVTFGSQESEFLIRLQAISPVTEDQRKASEAAFKNTFPDAELSKYELSPGGDKLTIRISKALSIGEVEEAVAKSGLTLDTIEQKLQPQGEKVSDNESNANEEESNKNCENVTCTWPYQGLYVYEVTLKGISERVMEGLRAKSFGQGAEKLRSEWVGPKVGAQLRWAAIASVGIALLFIMLYVLVRFDFRFSPGGVIALIHDAIITLGIFTFLRLEVTLATVAAILTIIGYSINDTIVVFDRIRENLGIIKGKKLTDVINLSVNQTLSRTILTSLTTLLVDFCMLVIGWKTTIRDFAFALFIGILVGTYSSIFIASPIVVWLDSKFEKKKA